MSRSNTMTLRSAPTMTHIQRPSTVFPHFDFHARQGQVFCAPIAGDPQRLVMGFDPADLQHRQEIGRHVAQEVHGDRLRFLARRQLTANQSAVDPSEALESAIRGDDNAEMLATECRVAAVRSFITHKFGTLAVQSDRAPSDFIVARPT